MKIPSFCSLVKKPQDLLSNVHSDGIQFKVKTKTDQGLTIETKTKQINKPGQEPSMSSNAKIIYNRDDKIKFIDELNSSGCLSFTGICERVENLKSKAKVQIQNDKSVNGSFELRYKHELATAKLQISEKPITKFCLATGKDGIGGGFQLGYDFNEQKLVAANTALFWFKKHQKLALRHMTDELKLGEFSMHYYQKLSPKTKVATWVTYPWGQSPTIQFGGEHKWHKDTKLNGLLSSKGYAQAALKQDLNSNVSLTVSANVDILKLAEAKPGENMKLGVQVNLQ